MTISGLESSDWDGIALTVGCKRLVDGWNRMYLGYPDLLYTLSSLLGPTL